MADPALARTILLLAPFIGAAALMLWLRPGHRLATGALLSFLWLLPAVTALNLLAGAVGWWRFHADGDLLLGLPVDVILGWAMFWGPFAALAGARVPLWVVVLVAIWVDILVMPRLAPLVVLGDSWLIGEAAAILCCLVPAQLFARWTNKDHHVDLRAVLHATGFGGLMMFLLPAVILDQTGRNLLTAVPRDFTSISLSLQILGLACIPGLAAVQEFAQVGGGTPVPWDPPKRLVVTGPYAYLANPMQTTIVLVCLVLAAILQAPLMVVAAAAAVAFSEGFVRWHQHQDIARRFGEDWRRYKASVRNWRPRWRPYFPAPATLYVAEQCDLCQELARWIVGLNPAGLQVAAGEDHPERDLARVTYRSFDAAFEDDGVAAVARALEHVNLFLALIGWTMRLPGIRHALQLLFDAVMIRPLDRCTRRVAATDSATEIEKKAPDGL